MHSLPEAPPREPAYPRALVDAVLDLTGASFAQGRAVERGDLPAAEAAHRASLVAASRLLDLGAAR